MRLRSVLAGICACVLIAGGLVAGTAAAARGGAYTCAGGEIPAGTYGNVLVTGYCTVPNDPSANVVISGNLIIAPGAAFDAQFHSTVEIDGNVLAGKGSLFGLGCTEAHPCNDGTPGTQTDVVKGTIFLNQVFDAAINGDKIYGSLISIGGGAGLLDPETDFVPFSIKDDEIKGNVIVLGLETVWFGIIRTQVGGNVLLNNINLSDPDGNEIVADQIGGNLVCHGMSPAPQGGDAVEGAPPDYGTILLGGHAIGQCAALPTAHL